MVVAKEITITVYNKEGKIETGIHKALTKSSPEKHALIYIKEILNGYAINEYDFAIRIRYP